MLFFVYLTVLCCRTSTVQSYTCCTTFLYFVHPTVLYCCASTVPGSASKVIFVTQVTYPGDQRVNDKLQASTGSCSCTPLAVVSHRTPLHGQVRLVPTADGLGFSLHSAQVCVQLSALYRLNCVLSVVNRKCTAVMFYAEQDHDACYRVLSCILDLDPLSVAVFAAEMRVYINVGSLTLLRPECTNKG